MSDAKRCRVVDALRIFDENRPMAVPGRIVDLHIDRLRPDDYRVTFTLESGEQLQVVGRELYDPSVPFGDSFDLWAFLVVQGTPVGLLSRELSAVDPDWESIVALRKARGDLDRQASADQQRRLRLRAEFKGSRETRS